jgi:hypothetical protein
MWGVPNPATIVVTFTIDPAPVPPSAGQARRGEERHFHVDGICLIELLLGRGLGGSEGKNPALLMSTSI